MHYAMVDFFWFSDDSWIEIKPDQLDDMLNKLSGKNVTQDQDAFNLEKVSENMKMFVEKVSSHEGAEFPKWALELPCRIVIM